MSKVLYKITKTGTYLHEDAMVESYGISGFEGGQEVLCYPDVLPDREKVLKLVHLCNALGVEPSQMEYILEDFLP